MSRMRLVCLGCGDAFSERWYSTSLALECDGCWLLIDCPHPIRKILREAGARAGLSMDVGTFSGLVLTHLHADHSSGLEGWAFYSKFVLNQRSALLAHRLVAENLWDGRLKASMSPADGWDGESQGALGFRDYFEWRALSEAAPVAHGPFNISCRRTHHPVATFAVRIEAGGRSVGYSSDTSFDPGLIEWLNDSDMIIHETNYGIHTPYRDLAALPGAVRSRMRLIHYPDDFDFGVSTIGVLRQGDCMAV